MPPPLQSPGNPNAVPLSHGVTMRENYSTPTPHIHSYSFPRGNPSFLPNSSQQSMIATSRSLEPQLTMSSTTSSGYGASNSAMPLDPAHYSLPSNSAPHFEKTKTLHSIVDSKGSQVHAELQAKIDKGFFKADQDWTCYRRNYFSVACSYSLKPPYIPNSEPLFLHRSNSTASDHIRALAMCITARVHGEDGKAIDLVQHTPKRDKGPLGRPEKIKLMPHSSGSLGIYAEPAGLSPSSQLSPEYDSSYSASSPNSQQNPTMANFDRIQFKNATANNGKRRAAQQYFNIVVELFAEVSNTPSSEPQWVKIAFRTSAPMVVRGRSPGHYSDDRRSSSTSMGPGGGSGSDNTGGPRDPGASGPPGGSRGGMGGLPFSGSSRMSGSTYLSHHASLNHSPTESRSSGSSSYNGTAGNTLDRPEDPVLSPEEASNIENYDGYQYYPSPLYETAPNGYTARPQLPPVRPSMFKPEAESGPSQHDPSYAFVPNSSAGHQTSAEERRSVKSELYDPSATSLHESQGTTTSRAWNLNPGGGSPLGRGCGRFQGVSTSRGYYPVTPAI